MRKYMTPFMAFAARACVAFGGLPESGIKPLHAQAPAKEDGPRAADAEPAPFNPQLGALMAMIIQPRPFKPPPGRLHAHAHPAPPCQARACRPGRKLAVRDLHVQGAQAGLCSG